MKPIIQDEINGFTFTWTEHDIIIHASRIHVHRADSHVSGEIYVQAVNGDGNKVTIYPPTSYNFSADRTRKELARSLSSKNSKLPWTEMVEQLCYGVQERARKGEPVIELNTSGEVKPPEYILYPLIVQNYPNVIFGDPSAAKSTLAVILAQVVMMPWHDNPMGLTAPQRSKTVLYLDWETDADTIRWQTTMLQRGIEGVEILFLQYRHCSLPLAQDVEQIKTHIADTKADLLIIDSQGLAAGGELKETLSPLSFYSALRGLKITSLILAHNSKDRESKTRSIYGNQFFTAQARNIWELRKDQDADSDELRIALFHRKPPPFSKIHKPLGFKLLYDNQTGKMSIEHSDPKTVEEFLKQMGLKAQILAALKAGGMSSHELALEIQTSEHQIRSRCGDLKKRGLIDKQNDKWVLLYDS